MATRVSTGFSSRRVFRMLGGMMVLALLLATGGLRAQTPTGSIAGTVKDSQGLSVDGATVTLTNQQTNYDYSAVTSSNGGYQFPSLDYGLYKITVAKPGFRNGVVENIKLDTATAYSVPPITLEVGTATDSVVVEAGAETVNTTNAEVTGTTEKKQIEELPILDRNPLALLNLQAGVANSGPGGVSETTINGQRSSFSNMTLDGINIQDNFIRENALDFSPNLPFLSQTQEFTITEQNGDVEKSGSSSVSIVTPKGTNKFHGEGFWFYRTNSWKANDWFNAASGVEVPRLLQNQGGGNIGGPIKKDKLFFYGYYELLRLRAQSPNNTTTLSPAIQAALASPTPTLPFTYQPLDSAGSPVGGLVTQDLLNLPNHNPYSVDPTTLAIIQRVPQLSNNTRAGDGLNLLGYQFNARSNNSKDNTGVRVDYNLNEKNTITGTYSYNRNYVDRPDIDLSFNKVPLVFNDDHVKFLSTAWRWNPTNSLTNEVRFGFNLAPAFFLTGQNFSSARTINSAGFPFSGPDPNFLPQGRKTHTWVWQDNASWIRGNHTIKFGTQVQRVTIFTTDSNGIYPDLQLGFSSSNGDAPVRTDFPSPAGSLISSSDYGNAIALLSSAAGILSNVSQTFNVTSQKSGYVPLTPINRNYRQNNIAFYAADNWKITRKLTVNYGLRWDYFSPVDERDGLTLLPVVPSGSTINQTLLSDATVDFAGGPSKRKLYNSYWKGFSPNIGVAWDPFGDGRTAVRAGFSINFVNDSFFTAADNAVTGNPGLSTTNTADPNGLPAGFTVSAAPPVAAPPFAVPVTFSQNANNLGVPNNVGYGIDPNLRPPYVEQWNLSIQRDLGAGTSLTVSYVGNHGVGLFRAVDLNQVVIGSNGFLQDFNKARSNGFIALNTPAGAPGCTGPGTADQCGQFNPLYNANLAGSQPLTIFPALCPQFGGLGLIGPPDYSGFPTFNNEIQAGTIGDLAHNYQQFSCSTTPGFFAPNDLILGADLLKNSSFSTYHAGVVEIRRRFSRGLYFQANYVFSKILTDYAPSVNNDQIRFQPYLDNARPRLERERAPFDFNHQFKANFTYELPIGHGHRFSSDRKWASLILDGWQTSSIFTWQSGSPFSILSTQATFNRGGTRSSHNTAFATLSHGKLAGDIGVFIQPGGVVYGINPALVSSDGTGAPGAPQLTCAPAVPGGFCNPQPGEVGNLQLNAFTGPTYFDWDLTASKAFPVSEKIKLTFRTDAFNVLNHPVFLVQDQNINSLQFGQSTSTVSQPRILQMSLALKF